MAKTKVNASPTKQFFVKMLTRDIDLLDAILDLLDNCVDGVIRTNSGRKKQVSKERPYENFHAKITATETEFVIEDNCGGIPREVAEKVAFRLGRPTDEELHELGVEIGKQGTVGLYGIGMKRAVFKMGRHAVITSENNGDAYNVEIDPAWLESGDWNLPMEDAEPDGEKGTRVRVTDLYEEIAHQFSGDTSFLDNLYDTISQLFAVIIDKGFTVHLNGAEIKPVSLRLLVSPTAADKGTISPYVFRGSIKGVDVEVVVGFHRDPSKTAQEGGDDESRAAAVKQAGWSVICNDRLVLYGDRSEMTGWGTRQIPYFHPQYNSIAGIVTMRSDDPALLPLNTTKRGIEVTGGVYLKVLDYMKDGVKRFIEYTNKWKGRLADTAAQFKAAKPVPVAEIPKSVPKDDYSPVGKSRLAADGGSAEEFKPDLELPKKEVLTRRICFTKTVEEIKEVAEGLLDDADAEPSAVGEECFDRARFDSQAQEKNMSGSSVAYHLRVNKYIDRRLFVEVLETVAHFQPLGGHAYISMGGGYLEDFRVVHQAFGIRRMLSFDLDDWVVRRQKLNRPYGFIRCEQAASGEIVSRFADERDTLVGPDGNVIVWLDYTQPGKRYEQLADLEALIGKLVPGDVFRITLNATRNTFGSNDQFVMAKRAGKTEHTTVAGWWNEKLAEQLGEYLPPDRNDAEFMNAEADFAATLARAVHRAALRGLTGHDEFILEPLLTVSYADGQQMVTVTGIVLKKDQRSEFHNRTRWDTWPYKPGVHWDNCVHLSVPHLSAVERKIIHDSLYYDAWPNFSRQLDFRLDEREDRHATMVDQYLTHYLRYPIFAPIDAI